MNSRCAFVVLCLGLLTTPAFSAGYDRSETTKLYSVRLRVPEAAMAISAVKTVVFARFKKETDEIKSDAANDKQDEPDNFHPFALDTNWRVTFESAKVLSLSADIYSDMNGAHPNQEFDTIVWDKFANCDVLIATLFAKGQAVAAMHAIADRAGKSWEKIYAKRSGDAPGQEIYDKAKDGIAPDSEHLKHYALTYAKGQSNANGIVLLYGAGAVWPHAAGNFRLSVPVSVFGKYLSPEWKPVFGIP